MPSQLERAARALLDALPANVATYDAHVLREALANVPLKAYPDRPMPAGFSTEGILIEGDKASIDRVVKDHHYAHHWEKYGQPAYARLQHATIHWEVEVKSTVTDKYVPQTDRIHPTLDSAESSVHDIKNFARREARIVRVTTLRELHE